MHTVNLPKRTFRDAYLNRSVKTLSKGISLTRTKDVDRACQLAILLYAAGYREDSLSLVHSFAGPIEYSELSGAWIGKETGLSLLAYDHFLRGEFESSKKVLLDLFESNPNLDLNETDWAFYRVEGDIEHYAPRSEWPEEIRHMRQNAVLGHSSQISSMLFNFLVLTFLCEGSTPLASRADSIIRRELRELSSMYNENDS